MRELKSAGYDGVEWRMTHVPEALKTEPPSFWGNNLCTLEPTEADARRGRALAEGAGLAVVGLGTYIRAGDLGATERMMHLAGMAGAPWVRVGVGTMGEGSYAETFDAAKDFLAGAETLAGKYGAKALVEIHHGTICPSASLAHRLVSGFDPGRVGVIFDPGNMVYEGFEDYRIGLELLGPYLAHVHLKNAAFERPEGGGVWKPRWAPLEDGVVNLEVLFAALRGVGYEGWLVVEDFSAVRPSTEALGHNLRLVRSLIGEDSASGAGGRG